MSAQLEQPLSLSCKSYPDFVVALQIHGGRLPQSKHEHFLKAERYEKSKKLIDPGISIP